ncbi:hypothetical protein [Halorubellus salinus]|uniref:hypothetical protein n=1 Tax=Halorubellus salinus TaxID=755309 RepID=UPI001D064A73|nr:hypothetical protein [Halorubellus salinus]
MSPTTRNSYTVGIGIVFGAALGLLAAFMLDFDIALGTAYGASTGIIVAAAVVAVATHENRLALGTLAGLLVGTGVGAVAAWSVDLDPLGGALAGAIVGFSLGAMLALTAPRDDRGPLAPKVRHGR